MPAQNQQQAVALNQLLQCCCSSSVEEDQIHYYKSQLLELLENHLQTNQCLLEVDTILKEMFFV
jgi:hypothetical protein